ncbi:MAG: hypothetical protein LBU91_00185 [Bacteroidales bacterium]|jgi:hypothetical protein|nr:hypothetical protein [Bacteroidales bacterium]
MTQKLLQQILSDYTQMSVDSLIELKNLIEDYPYCQTAQILYLLNLKRLGEDTFDVRLPYTAICVHNRERLKENVQSIERLLAKEFGQVQPSKKSKSAEHSRQSKPLDLAKHSESVQKSSSLPLNFRNKTISELFEQVDRPPVTRVKLPVTATADDILLEQLRQEAVAKVNERLLEIRQTEMVEVDFSEMPKRMRSAQALIDHVIATNPTVSKPDEANQKSWSQWKVKEEHSLRDDYELVSETLATLYIAQGAPDKALEVYKTLSKKFPEKADYFAKLSKPINSKKTKSKHKNQTSKIKK